MPSLNFMERFAGAVERGEKRQTIRRVRKTPIKVGDTLQLYTGQRTKACRKLGLGRCTRVRAIMMRPDWTVWRERELLGFLAIARLAHKDGFEDAGEAKDAQ